LESDIAVAHPAGRFHQLRELAPDLLPRVVGEEPGENVQAAAQAADGDAQVVDGIGVAVAGGAVQLVGEAPQQNRSL